VNYDQPREMKGSDGEPTGRWHYTRMNDGRIWATGYCAQGCPGHDDKAGAYELQRQYELDNARYGIVWGEWNPCQVCGELTNQGATWGLGNLSHARLCPAHQDRQHLDPFVTAGDAISSF
jgi:hypothetical protein